METLTIKIKDNKALRLIQHLADLDLIEVTSSVKDKRVLNLSALISGSISEEQAYAMHQELEQMRSEWERDVYPLPYFKSYSVDEISAAGGATAFAEKMGNNAKDMVEKLKKLPEDAFLTEEEVESALELLRRK